MRDIGSICCVQLYSEGKELTKIRQNRNYDPNQGECNQYAIYSDVICGFEKEAVLEVFQEDQDHTQALTETILLQRGMVLYGPVKRDEKAEWETLKPFGNEKYLLHTVETADGGTRAFYWNPEAIITWRQRKKALKNNAEIKKITNEEPLQPAVKKDAPASQDEIPIGEKLAILDEQRSSEEHISVLNVPVSDFANRLEDSERKRRPEKKLQAASFHATPMKAGPQNGDADRYKEPSMFDVVESQLKEKKSSQKPEKCEHRHVSSPIENLRSALREAWQIPCLHQEMIRTISENRELMQTIVQASPMERQARIAYSAAKAEMDEIEAERIALLVELDKTKANYQHAKEKILAEMTKQKQGYIAKLDAHLSALKAEKESLEKSISSLGDELQEKTIQYFAENQSMRVTSTVTDITISPMVGHFFERSEIVESIRTEMNAVGFMCNQDCVTEFLILFSSFDEIVVKGEMINITELYTKCLIRAMGLLNVTAWPGVFGTMHLVSLLPENELRTPTVEVTKNKRIMINAYGHKTIRIADESYPNELSLAPVIHVPAVNKAVTQDKLNFNGVPISLQTLHAFSQSSVPLSLSGEAWFDTLEEALKADGLQMMDDIFHIVRMFARIAAPQLVGGFIEAADAAVLAWIVPVLMDHQVMKEHTMKLISSLPRCMKALS